MQLCNLSLIDTDDIINDMFDFKPTEALNERFEHAGYDSTNFFILLGIFLFIILLTIIWMTLRKLLQKLAYRSKSEFFLIQWLKTDTNFKKNLLIFLQESAIELSVCASICIANISEDNFKRFSEGLSTVSALLIGPLVLIVPLYLIRAKRRYQEEIFVRKEKKFYADFFPELRPEDPLALYYRTVFLIRRLMIICIAVL